jgi:survival motor neuron protein
MEIILVLGNFINGGTSRGSCLGFKFNALNKLGDTKAKDNKRTLMHFLCKYCKEKFPELLAINDEVEAVFNAVRVGGTTMEADIAGLNKSLKAIQITLDAIKKTEGVPDENGEVKPDPFVIPMAAFIATSQEAVDELQSAYKEMNEVFAKVLSYFGEDSAKPPPPEDFFKELATFLNNMSRAAEENQKMVEQEAKERKREEERKKRLAAEAQRNAKKGTKPGDDAVVDGFMNEMLNGGIFNRRRRAPGSANKGAADAKALFDL